MGRIRGGMPTVMGAGKVSNSAEVINATNSNSRVI